MNLEDKIEELKTALKQEDLINEGKKVFSLKIDFDDQILKFESSQQRQKLNAKDQGIDYTEISVEHLKLEFSQLFQEFSLQRKKQIEVKNLLERENYKQKIVLLKELKDLVENEEKINAAFSQLKIIQDTWNKIGDVPRDKREETQRDFSRLMELFYYNINIYKELKDHDFKRNLQLKENVIFELKKLRNSSNNLKELELNLRKLQNEWEEIGPVQSENWQVLKQNYWETVRGIYEKINNFYSELKQKRREFILEKERLIQEVNKINDKLKNFQKASDWQSNTNEIIQIQKNWKVIGHGSKKDNDRVWNEFRKACDLFFEKKSDFFQGLKQQYQSVINQKKTLIEEVRSFNNSSQSESSTKIVIGLQKKWKETGNAGPKHENKLWREFRKECETFFDLKQKEQESKQAQFEEIIVSKKSFIKNFEKQSLEGTLKEIIPNIYDSIRKYDEIGELPVRDATKLNNEFKRVIENSLEKYDGVELDLKKICFHVDLISIKDDKSRKYFLTKEKNFYRKKQEKIILEINQLENNLGFFSNSKNSGNMLEEFENQISTLKKELVKVDSVIKIIPNE